MSWDALSLAGAHAIDNSAGIASVNPTAATYAASVAASDLAALGLPPLPASVRRVELAVECHDAAAQFLSERVTHGRHALRGGLHLGLDGAGGGAAGLDGAGGGAGSRRRGSH